MLGKDMNVKICCSRIEVGNALINRVFTHLLKIVEDALLHKFCQIYVWYVPIVGDHVQRCSRHT